MRRTLASLLVVASPLLLTGPVGAEAVPDRSGAEPTVVPALPAVVEGGTPAVPAPLGRPAAPAVTGVAAPAAAAATALSPPPAMVRSAVTAVRAKAPTASAVNDAAYAAHLQAELCLARQVFCGLDHNGRYPAG